MNKRYAGPAEALKDVRFYMNLSYACSKKPLLLGAFLLGFFTATTAVFSFN